MKRNKIIKKRSRLKLNFIRENKNTLLFTFQKKNNSFISVIFCLLLYVFIIY